ncbi:MAG TPA: TIR domain-containing protein [Steroidobacteraceae bacterium]|nr:TIR domain-containing protein [Steroidobacteraceae bacterium]
MPTTQPSRAVFLSHASEDDAAALRIAAALRAAGIEVWLDRSELKGGDAWDHSIRQQLRECTLFMPVISHYTTSRPEAYFRLEWHLADQRTLHMAQSKAFVVPVCIDDTSEAEAEVPESFRAVHWMRLPGGTATPAFREHIASLLQAQPGRTERSNSHARTPAAPAAPLPAAAADIIRLGPFELLPAERQLRRDGQPIELGARAFDLLQVLAEQAGRLVTKATLLERVWPKLVVDENNLPSQIASLRRVLGAAAIRTVPGFGYRLELEVVRPSPSVASAPTEPPRAPAPLPVRVVTSRLTPLIGRDRDLQALQAALEHARCVTAVGAAGIGKTRLAQEVLAQTVAAPARQGAWVDLGPLTQLRHVASAIALAVGVTLPDRGDGFTALERALAQVPLLLVFDGAEHLAGELAPALAQLLARTGELRALVTSQVPLGVPGETVFRLGPLAVDEPSDSGSPDGASDAIALFVQRATAADRRFALTSSNRAAVAEICRRLDGNPLALELAAARVPALGVAALLEHLGDRLRLLKSSAAVEEPHHGALQAAFDWSYQLLSPAEQRVFNRLGVFSGSFSLDSAARCVTDGPTDSCDAIDLISRLVDRSLVNALPSDSPRYALSETARLYALARLAEAGEEQSARRGMGAAMLELLDRAYVQYWSEDEALWLPRYEPELENVRAAITWATAHAPELAVRLYGSAWPLLFEADLNAEGRHSYHHTVGLLSEGLPRAAMARFWEAIATFESTRQCDRARYAAELAAQMHADTGDLRARYYALMLLASNWRIDNEAARAAFDTARTLEDPAWPARLLALGAQTEGALLLTRGDFAGARAAYQRAMRASITVSERQALAAISEVVELDLACGDPAAALQLARPLVHRLRHSSRSGVRFGLLVATLEALLQAGELEEARAIAHEILEVGTRFEPARLYTALDAMTQLACAEKRYTEAARIAACADAAYALHGQGERRLTEARLRAQTEACLERELGTGWRESAVDRNGPLEERSACALALGLDV